MENIKDLEEQITCRFEKTQTTLTVGDVFELHCQWPITLILSSPVRVEFSKKTNIKSNGENQEKPLPQEEAKEQSHQAGPYSLVVLDTVNIYPGRGVFKVTSYKPGDYHTGFNLVSDQGIAKVKPLSWKVKSVIPLEKKQTIKPYPPYGPWKEVLPFWHWPLSVAILLSLFGFITFKLWLFIKRKNKIQEVRERLKNKTSFREFISQLNLLNRQVNSAESGEIIQKLDKHFRFFLENEFFIFALQEKPRKIIRQLKKYYPVICEQCDIEDFFKEIEKLSAEKAGVKEYEQMLDMARDIAISCLEQTQKKNTAKRKRWF